MESLELAISGVCQLLHLLENNTTPFSIVSLHHFYLEAVNNSIWIIQPEQGLH